MKRKLKIAGLILGDWLVLAFLVGVFSRGPATMPETTAPVVEAHAPSPPPEQPKPDLELLTKSGEVNEYAITISGSIRNNRPKDYRYVQVVFDLYDKGGAKVGTAMANVSGLAHGETWKSKAVSAKPEATDYKLAAITGW